MRLVKKKVQVARHYKVTDRTVRNWIKSGMPVRKDGTFDLDTIDQWHLERKGVLPPPSAGGELEQSQTKGKDFYDAENKRWQAKTRKLEYRKRRGELLEKERVVELFVARIQAVKQGLLSLERSLPPQLIACRDERAMAVVIRQAVRRLLEAYARPLPAKIVQQETESTEG